MIDRMAVRWQAHGFTGVGSAVEAEGEQWIDAARLERLIGELLAGALGDAIAATGIGRDQLVCLRSVTVPPTTVWWDRPDADVVATWARAVAEAVAESTGRSRSRDDVVRYRTLEEAMVDLAVSCVGGDVRRAWAWRQLGLWPIGSPVEAVTVRESADVAAAVLADHPEQVVAVLVVLAASGRLPETLAFWGADRCVALVAAAWGAHGGDRRVVTDDGLEAASRDPVLVPVEAVLATSVLARAAAGTMGARAPDVGRGSGPGGTLAEASAPLGHLRLARALAAASVLDAEPVVARRSSPASALVAALTERFLGPRVEPEHAPATGAAGPRDLGQPERRRPGDGAPGAVEPSAPDAAADPPAAEGSTPAPGGTDQTPEDRGRSGATAWGGLLFLLHVVDDLADLADQAVEVRATAPVRPVPAWPPARPALHRLAHTLATRALPDVDPPPPEDPALLTFAGLTPDAASPEPGVDDEPPPVAHARADAVVAALRARLDASPLGEAPEPALLAAVLRRSARIIAEPGWVEVVLDLDQTSVAVRRAGLDLDPGWVPWLGRVVRFRYV